MKRTSRKVRSSASPPPRDLGRNFPIVGIGASAGGLAPMSELLRALPPKPGMAFVVITHMDPEHASILDSLLARESTMPIQRVANGTRVRPSTVYVVTPDKSVTLLHGTLRTQPRVRDGGMSPTVIDKFLVSLARDRHTRARGVVLSGIGSDGTEGLKMVRLEGGVTFAQDPRSAQFDSMPANAIRAGCVDVVLPPAAIAQHLAQLGNGPEFEFDLDDEAAAHDTPFRQVLATMLRVTGTDFSENRAGTLRRRIARRMALKHFSSLASYARHLRKDADEVRALHADLFIHVSSFFRDPKAFAALERKVIRDIARRRGSEPLRVWVPGCSKGEEVYTLGMLLLEQLSGKGRRRRVQLFGTDIGPVEVNAARVGRYPPSIASDVGARRLKRFFVEVPGGYQVGRELRDACVFAQQDITSDPPFSKIDLISCRNVLMYFTRPLQARLLNIFHYALRPDGYLLLGHSETAGSSSLFSLVDRRHRIYQRKEVAHPPLWRTHRATDGQKVSRAVARAPDRAAPELRASLDRMLVERYAPPGFYVDEDLVVQSFQGDIGSLLKPASGSATLHLARLVPPALALDIRTAIRASRKRRQPVRRESTLAGPGGSSQPVTIAVIPVAKNDERKAGHLVLFEQKADAEARNEDVTPARRRPEVVRLRKALATMREQLQTLMEEKDATEQELRTAHEEVLSSNEELQSSNEELETGKEELQSANEELTTVNEELQKRNDELDRLTGELGGLITGLNIPVINLDRERRILRFSPAAQGAFNLIASDIGRLFDHIKPPVIAPDLDGLITAALRRGVPTTREVQDRGGHWHALRVRAHRGTNSRIEGVLITLVDIDAAKRRAAAVVETIREPLLVLDADLRVLSANPAFLQSFRMTQGDVEGRPLFKLGQGQWDFPELRRLMQDVLPRHRRFAGFRIEHTYPGVGARVFLMNAQQVLDEGEGTETILLAFLDVTEQERVTRELRDMSARLRSAREAEDKRVAHDLHDLSSEGLAALSLEVARLEQISAASPGEARKGLRRIRQRVRQLAQNTHELARRLHPTVLDDLGLARALRAEGRSIEERYGLKTSVHLGRLPRTLPDAIALCAYRVSQEALRNASRHAHAGKVDIRVHVARGQLHLAVHDNGVGLDLASARASGGLGLVSMEDRVAAVGGTFVIESAPRRGTTVKIRLPLGEKP